MPDAPVRKAGIAASVMFVLIVSHGSLPAQDSARTRASLTAVARAALRSATFRFVDGKSRFDSDGIGAVLLAEAEMMNLIQKEKQFTGLNK